MKKILLAVVAVLILLIGGLALFINTKSDFIIQKVSEIIEKSLDAKLTMEKLPSISFFPALAVSADKSSLTAKDYVITFDKAGISISLAELLMGNVHINSVNLDTLTFEYIANTDKKTQIQKQDSNQDSNQSASETSTSETIEKILALIPSEISITNSNIYYKDNNQKLAFEKVNARIEDFGLNKNSVISLQGAVSYKNLDPNADKNGQDIALNIDTHINFLFMGESLDYTIKNLTLSPTKGFPFTEALNISAESSMNIKNLMIEKLDSDIDSPFGKIHINGKGNPEHTKLNIEGTINALAVQNNILPDTALNNIPQSIALYADLVYSPKTIAVNDITLNLHDGLIKINGIYDIIKQDLTAKLYAENLQINDYLPPKADTANKKNTADKKNIANKENTTGKKNTPDKPRTNPQDKEEANSSPSNLNLNLSLTADAKNIQYNALPIESIHSLVTGKISDKETIFHINPLTVVSNQDTINATAKLELAPKDLISVTLDAPSLQARHWSKMLAEKTPLDALLNIQSTMQFKSADPINTLNGNADIEGKAIRIETKLLPFISNLLQLNLKLDDVYEFSTLKAPLTIKNGQISTSNSYVDSAVIQVNAKGNAHLGKNTVNMHGNAELKKQGLIFPYKVTGELGNPKISLDLSKQLLILGSGILHTGEDVGTEAKDIVMDSGKLLEQGLNKIFGK